MRSYIAITLLFLVASGATNPQECEPKCMKGCMEAGSKDAESTTCVMAYHIGPNGVNWKVDNDSPVPETCKESCEITCYVMCTPKGEEEDDRWIQDNEDDNDGNDGFKIMVIIMMMMMELDV